MKLIQISLFALLLLSGALCIITPELYEEIKKNAPFEILEYHKIKEIFKDVKVPTPDESLKKMKDLEEHIEKELEVRKNQSESDPDTFLPKIRQKINLPKEFDWRKIKPECFTPPKHQMACGCCYIFAPIAAFESRLCIKSGGSIKNEFSVQEILSCETDHNKCFGGYITNTWNYLETVGTCNYHCRPYVSFDGSVPKCEIDKCDYSYFTNYKWKAKLNSMTVFSKDEQRMKQEIYLNGPINGFMETFEDFSSYKSGLYFHTVGKQTDPHAITIVGWGYDEQYKSDYWIIRNSWGTEWGENGYVKILKGLYKLSDFIATSLPDI